MIRPGVFAAPVDSRLKAKELVCDRSRLANLTCRMTCFSTGPGITPRLLTTVLTSGPTSATARSATSWLDTLPLSDAVFWDARISMSSLGKVSFNSF